MELPYWIPERSPLDRHVAILRNFIYHTNVPVTQSGIRQALYPYQLYNTLPLEIYASILRAWKLQTICVTLNAAKLTDLHYPVITYLSPAGDPVPVLIYQAIHGQVMYLHPRLGWASEPTDIFQVKWDGKVVLAIPVKGCGEAGYEHQTEKHRLELTTSPMSDHVKTIKSFLSAKECQGIIELSAPLFSRSQVVSDESARNHSGRSSFTAMLEKNDNTHLRDLYLRSAHLLKVPLENLEYGQCVSYQTGQEYQAHYDTPDAGTPMGQKIITKYGQRIVTLLIYLNDDFQGGETYFPNLDYKVRPETGMAVIFKNTDREGNIDPNSLHAGLPVFSGQKFAFNLWGWSKPFRKIPNQ